MASHGTERNGAAARQPVLNAACGARATAGGAGSTAGASYAEKHTTQLNEETSRDVMYIKEGTASQQLAKRGRARQARRPPPGAAAGGRPTSIREVQANVGVHDRLGGVANGVAEQAEVMCSNVKRGASSVS